jgi:Ran GTPase-activating protein (RanGAP) involved in mRNA processing and transport
MIMELDLSSNKIGSQTLKLIAESINSTTLTSLDISRNKKEQTDGLQDLCKAIGDNSTIETLRLSSLGVNEVVAATLSETLACNAALLDLDLSFNELGAAGASALAKGLPNSNLMSLDLSFNGSKLQ